MKCKVYFSTRRVPTRGPNLRFGQLHFFSQIFLKQLHPLLKVAILPILHVLRRKNIVHLYIKNHNSKFVWKENCSLFQKQEKTLPKLFILDYSFFVCPFINSQGDCQTTMPTSELLQDSRRGKTTFLSNGP